MEYCEGGSLDAIYKQIKRRKGRTGEKVLGKMAESVRCAIIWFKLEADGLLIGLARASVSA